MTLIVGQQAHAESAAANQKGLHGGVRDELAARFGAHTEDRGNSPVGARAVSGHTAAVDPLTAFGGTPHQPGSWWGDLNAHELALVVESRGGASSPPLTEPAVHESPAVREQDADRIAEQRTGTVRSQREAPFALGEFIPRNTPADPAHLRMAHLEGVEGRDVGSAPVPPVVHEALREPDRPLDGAARGYFEPRFGYDFTQVRVHTGGLAARSAKALGAHAYTVGNDMVFGEGKYAPDTEGGKRLIAHELTHVIQQRHGALRVERQEEGTTTDLAQQIVTALNSADPIAGVGDYVTAYNLLNGLSMPGMLNVLNELAAQLMLEVLISREPPQGVDVPRISAAITLVRLANSDASSIQQSELESFAHNAQSLPDEQQQAMLNFAGNARRISAATREGLVAMMASEVSGATLGGLSPAVAQGVTGPVNPAPWNPPGNQPIPFYIGNQAHVGIAASYTAAHPGELPFIFTNFISLSTILQQAAMLGLSPSTGSLNGGDLALKPDILNLAPTSRHLFEIKPTSLQNTGRREANMYVGLLKAAGVPVTLGPIGERGTNGAIPAPGGVYLFETPEAGVIVYQYRRQRLVPDPVPVGEPAFERRWKLAPLTPQQQAVMVTTTAAGVMLIIMMILLSPVGV